MIWVLIVGGVIFVLAALTILLGQVAFSITPRPGAETPASLSRAFEDIYFANEKGDLLHGWWMPHSDADAHNPLPTLVLVHGWNRNCARMLPYLRHLTDLRMNLLCIEARGHGENAKNSFITMLAFARDLMSALDWLVLRPEVQPEGLGVLGHSVGAAATIYATARDKRISFFVADAAFAHPREIIRSMLGSHHIPYFPIGWLIVQYIQLRLGTTLDAIAPVNAISRITVPGLMIHGNQDTVVPVEDSFRIIANARENVDLWIASGANHSDTAHHPEFRDVLRAFLEDRLDTIPISNQGDFLDLRTSDTDDS